MERVAEAVRADDIVFGDLLDQSVAQGRPLRGQGADLGFGDDLVTDAIGIGGVRRDGIGVARSLAEEDRQGIGFGQGLQGIAGGDGPGVEGQADQGLALKAGGVVREVILAGLDRGWSR